MYTHCTFGWVGYPHPPCPAHIYNPGHPSTVHLPAPPQLLGCGHLVDRQAETVDGTLPSLPPPPPPSLPTCTSGGMGLKTIPLCFWTPSILFLDENTLRTHTPACALRRAAPPRADGRQTGFYMFSVVKHSLLCHLVDGWGRCLFLQCGGIFLAAAYLPLHLPLTGMNTTRTHPHPSLLFTHRY